MAKRKRLKFPPRSWQMSPWQSDAWRETENLEDLKKIHFVCGRGAGKDIAVIRLVLRDALKLYGKKREQKRLGQLPSELNPIVKIWVIAPSDDNLAQPWADWKGALDSLAIEWGEESGHDPSDHSWLYREIIRENKYILFGAGEIEIEKRLSSTKNALRGPGVDIVHWSEFAIQTSSGELITAYTMDLPGTITRAGRLGRVYTTTTPLDDGSDWAMLMRQEVGEEFKEVRNQFRRFGRVAYCNADSFSNTFLTQDQLDSIQMEKVRGESFERERLGLVVDVQESMESVFPLTEIKKNYITQPIKRKGSFRSISCGLDVARLGGDSTVATDVDVETIQILRVRAWQKTTGPEIINIIESTARNYGIPNVEIQIDETSHQAYLQDWVPDAIRVMPRKFYENEKARLILNLLFLLQIGKLKIPHPDEYPFANEDERAGIRLLVSQLIQFRKVVTSQKKVKYQAPGRMHDDAVISLALAVYPIAEQIILEGDHEHIDQNLRELMGI